MALILSIETATKVCSVALTKEGRLLALQKYFMEKSHAELLAQIIKDIICYCNYTMKDIAAIALSEGPGSYTGLRIGTATAKGLCFALEIPLIAINTLEAMAFGLSLYNPEGAWLCPMIDARRMEVYYLLADNKMNLINSTNNKVIDSQSFESELAEYKIFFFGDGAAKCKTFLSPNPNAYFIDGVSPSAAYIGQLAYHKFEAGNFEDLAYFEPFYLKNFRAIKPSKS